MEHEIIIRVRSTQAQVFISLHISQQLHPRCLLWNWTPVIATYLAKLAWAQQSRWKNARRTDLMGGVELRQDCVLRWRPGRSVSLDRCPDTEKAGSSGGGGSAESRSRGVVGSFWWEGTGAAPSSVYVECTPQSVLLPPGPLM